MDAEQIKSIIRKHVKAGQHTTWFEELYATAAGNPNTIPWADQAPNPHLTSWFTPKHNKAVVTNALSSSAVA